MPDLTIVNLRVEATAEAGRLASARAVYRDGDDRALTQLQGDATWIAWSRRSARRRLPGRRIFVIWRVAMEDGAGHLVESRLVPVAIEIACAPPRARRREWIQTLLRQIDADLRGRVDTASTEWREAAAKATNAFASARVNRERAIATRPLRTNLMASQPGLFDRRAERCQLTQAATIAASEQAAVDRLRTVDALATITSPPARLLLVLGP